MISDHHAAHAITHRTKLFFTTARPLGVRPGLAVQQRHVQMADPGAHSGARLHRRFNLHEGRRGSDHTEAVMAGRAGWMQLRAAPRARSIAASSASSRLAARCCAIGRAGRRRSMCWTASVPLLRVCQESDAGPRTTTMHRRSVRGERRKQEGRRAARRLLGNRSITAASISACRGAREASHTQTPKHHAASASSSGAVPPCSPVSTLQPGWCEWRTSRAGVPWEHSPGNTGGAQGGPPVRKAGRLLRATPRRTPSMRRKGGERHVQGPPWRRCCCCRCCPATHPPTHSRHSQARRRRCLCPRRLLLARCSRLTAPPSLAAVAAAAATLPGSPPPEARRGSAWAGHPPWGVPAEALKHHLQLLRQVPAPQLAAASAAGTCAAAGHHGREEEEEEWAALPPHVGDRKNMKHSLAFQPRARVRQTAISAPAGPRRPRRSASRRPRGRRQLQRRQQLGLPVLSSRPTRTACTRRGVGGREVC